MSLLSNFWDDAIALGSKAYANRYGIGNTIAGIFGGGAPQQQLIHDAADPYVQGVQQQMPRIREGLTPDNMAQMLGPNRGQAFSKPVGGAYIAYQGSQVQTMSTVDNVVRAVPVAGDAAGFVIDLPNRTFDTVALVGQAASAARARNGNTDSAAWGELLNASTWSRAWQDFEDKGHLSVGQVVAARMLGNDPRVKTLNPFDAAEAQQLQKLAAGTTYGALMAGFTDVAAGFVNPLPGSNLMKAARASKVIHAEDLGRLSEGMNQRLMSEANDGNAAAIEPKQGLPYAKQRAKDTVKAYFGGHPSTESLVDQFLRGVRGTDGILDPVKMSDHLAPWLEHAPEKTRLDIADLFALTNHIDEPGMRTHAKANMMLAAMGSKAAKDELLNVAPEVGLALQEKMQGLIEPRLFDTMVDRYVTSGDLRINPVMDEVFNVPSVAFRQQIIKDQFLEAAQMAKTAVENRIYLNEHAPLTRDTIAERRQHAEFLQKQVEDMQTGRKNTPPEGLGPYMAERDQAWKRVNELEAQYAHQTPGQVHAWDQAATQAKYEDVAATAHLDQMTAERNAVNAELADTINQRTSQQNLDAVERLSVVLNKLWDLKDPGGFIGTTEPSWLAQVKTAYRNRVGESYLYKAGYLRSIPVTIRTMNEGLASIGTPYARGGLNMAEPDRGLKEMSNSLRHARGNSGSEMFTGQEIHDYAQRWMEADQAGRLELADEAHREMLKRIARSFHMSEREAYTATQIAVGAYDQGRMHLARAAQDAANHPADIAIIETPSGHPEVWRGAALRTHLSDTVRWIDPEVYLNALRRNETGLRAAIRNTGQYAQSAVQFGTELWKHGTLIRAGLGVRAMLDTGLRATALLGAATQFAQATNGAVRAARLKGERGLTRMGVLHGGDVTQVAARAMGLKPFTVDAGGGFHFATSAYGDPQTMAMLRMQMTKGASIYDSMMKSNNRLYAFLRENMANWEWFDKEHRFWALAWKNAAENLYRSPTGRALIDRMEQRPLQRPDVAAVTRELMSDPRVASEYREIGVPLGLSEDEWMHTLVDQVQTMFPKRAGIDMIANGAVTDAAIRKLFPKRERFDIPAWSVMLDKEQGAKALVNLVRRWRDGFYRQILDEPDFWLARHPVYVTTYQRTLMREAKAMRQTLGEGEHISEADFRTLESRARSYALSTVRKTFYDTTRHTTLGESLSKIAPFFHPWEDAMMSWSRLIYDDPSRIFRLAGGWNALDNATWAVEQTTGDPLLVDGEGRPVDRGGWSRNTDGSKVKSDSGVYMAVPWKVMGVQPQWRKEGLNSIAQGNIWYSPGLGPQAVVPATIVIGHLPRDVAAQLAGTDSWLGKFLLNNAYLDGEIPKGDVGSVAWSLAPAYIRNAFNDSTGINAARNKVYIFNQAYIDAQKKGLPFDPKKEERIAEHKAWAAAAVRFISQAGLGMSGKATVQGQFYVDQQHILDAIPQQELQKMGYPNSMAAFAKMFPEAADLDFRFGVNETGVTASVNAQKSAAKEQKLIDDYPDLGWFIVGGENVAQGRPGDEFSMSVYNQQASNGYGLQQAGRRQPDKGQAMAEAITAIGWKEWHTFTLGLDEYARRRGLPDEFKVWAKQQKRDQLGAKYPTWLNDYTTRNDRLVNFFVKADAIAKRPGMAKHPDIQAYVDYRKYRQEVLDQFDIKSLSGTTAPYALARWKLRMFGGELSSQNIGFSQTWDRMLSAEVDAKDTDEQVLGGLINGTNNR